MSSHVIFMLPNMSFLIVPTADVYNKIVEVVRFLNDNNILFVKLNSYFVIRSFPDKETELLFKMRYR